MDRERRTQSGLETEAKVPVGTHVIWDDDGNKCKGIIKETFYDNGAFKRWFYVVEFEEEGIGKYTRKFDDQSFNEDLKVDTTCVEK